MKRKAEDCLVDPSKAKKLIKVYLSLAECVLTIEDEEAIDLAKSKRIGFEQNQENSLLPNGSSSDREKTRPTELDDLTQKFESDNQATAKFRLTPEEAIHCVTTNNYISVYDRQTNSPIPKNDLWSYFSDLDRSFPFKAVAYKFLKSKNWTVRYGLKFGCDFLLYQGDVDQFHSRYGVVVIQEQQRNYTAESKWKYGYRAISAIVRELHAAKKGLVLCFVSFPVNQCFGDVRDLDSAVVRTLKLQRFKQNRRILER